MLNRESEYLRKILEREEIPIVSKKKNDYIMLQGFEMRDVYILKEGCVKISNKLYNGREWNIRYVLGIDFVSLLEEELNDVCVSLFDVRVESECAYFYRLPRRKFMGWLEDDLYMSRIVSNFYKRRLKDNVKSFSEIVVSDKKGALCAKLYHLVELFGSLKEEGVLIDFPVTNEVLADFCGISEKSSVSRLLRNLVVEGVIKREEERKILVYQPEYLKSYVVGKEER